MTSSASARCAMIWRRLHLPGAGTKSSSSPNTPVSTTARTSGPRRNRSRRVGKSAIVSIVIGAAQVVAALFADQLTFSCRKAHGTDGTVQHRLVVVGFPGGLRSRVEFFHDCPILTLLRRRPD